MSETFHLVQEFPPFYIQKSLHDRGFAVDPSGNGEGSLGTVKKFTNPYGPQAITIKKCTNPLESKVRGQLILRELINLRTISHENLLHFLGSYMADDDKGVMSIYHITLYCGEPLRKKIEEGRYSMEDARKWNRELLLGLQHLHMNNVVFRNLHPGNICIDSKKKLTITGFGKSRVIDRNMTQDRGTAPYMPIELLMEEAEWSGEYDEKVDIWTAATILCEVITGQPIFAGKDVKSPLKRQMEYCGPVEDHVLANVRSESERHKLQEFSKKCVRKDFITILQGKMLKDRCITKDIIKANEADLRDFIENSLQFDPDIRMSAEELLERPFVTNALQPAPSTNVEAASLQQLQTLIDQELRSSPDCVTFLKASCEEN